MIGGTREKGKGGGQRKEIQVITHTVGVPFIRHQGVNAKQKKKEMLSSSSCSCKPTSCNNKLEVDAKEFLKLPKLTKNGGTDETEIQKEGTSTFFCLTFTS